eukprot:472300-Lingulodinium_polyedra.AAC.1
MVCSGRKERRGVSGRPEHRDIQRLSVEFWSCSDSQGSVLHGRGVPTTSSWTYIKGAAGF